MRVGLRDRALRVVDDRLVSAAIEPLERLEGELTSES
jgi:hypothetical protein